MPALPPAILQRISARTQHALGEELLAAVYGGDPARLLADQPGYSALTAALAGSDISLERAVQALGHELGFSAPAALPQAAPAPAARRLGSLFAALTARDPAARRPLVRRLLMLAGDTPANLLAQRCQHPLFAAFVEGCAADSDCELAALSEHAGYQALVRELRVLELEAILGLSQLRRLDLTTAQLNRIHQLEEPLRRAILDQLQIRSAPLSGNALQLLLPHLPPGYRELFLCPR